MTTSPPARWTPTCARRRDWMPSSARRWCASSLDRFFRTVFPMQSTSSTPGRRTPGDALGSMPETSSASYADHSRLLSAFDHFADRKSTRLNSSHLVISYAVFCLKKKNILPRRFRQPLSYIEPHYAVNDTQRFLSVTRY